MLDVKRLKDPIYGYINIPTLISKKIIDTAPFQRLRRIVQTSYSPLYASSVHNRFVHSLGVFYFGTIAANSIRIQMDSKQIIIGDLDTILDIFLLACLLHDIGHAPFSHTGEQFYLDDSQENKYDAIHSQLKALVGSEQFSKDVPIVKTHSAAPHEIMSAIVGIMEFEEFLPNSFHKEFFSRCITGYKYLTVTLENSFLNCLISLLNSKVIDVDRLDYLIRDAFFTGFNTISIDYERLLSSLSIVEKEDESKEEDNITYEIAYQKTAISVIENVVYAHDAERKWIQNHPIVLYDIYILQHIINKINSKISTKDKKLFSVKTLSLTGVTFSENIKVSLLSDDDIIYLMKSDDTDQLCEEYFQRDKRRHPLWKSEAEYKAYLLRLIGKGDILNRIHNALIETEKYVQKNSESWIINSALISKLEREVKSLENDDASMLKKSTILKQLTTKKSIMKVFKSIEAYSKLNDEECDFVILSASQFYSGFNRPDITNINIVFSTPTGEKVSKLGEIVSLLSGNELSKDDFFYLYHKSNLYDKIDKQQIFELLIKEFVMS